MSYDRILVDGYSLTHAWPELRKLQRRNFAAARDALVAQLTSFAAHSGQPVTIVFDATNRPQPLPPEHIPHCEVLFSAYGETADDLIERAVAEAADPARLLVVTDDSAEQMTVQSFGAFTLSADLFHSMVQDEIAELDRRIRHTKTQTRAHFRRGPLSG
jgi:predicted RNA-binding protein with PIN domain